MKQYTVTGMSCAACSARVEKAVSKVDGVTSCSVSLLTNSMGVEGSATDAQIVEAVEQAGYGASPKGTATESENDKANNSLEQLKAAQDALVDRETPKLVNRLIASIIFLVVLMYFSMGHMMWGWPLPEFFNGNHVAMGLLQLLLTVAVMVINQKFFISGFKGLIHGAPNMDTLVALGSAASFGYSVYALFAMTAAQVNGDMDAVMSYMHEFYFESAAMILALITVGKMLEAHSKGKTTDALKSLMQLAPKTATVVRDGVEQEISVDAVKKGDIFVVRPGENIPVDGEIIDGTTAVNESALTGESIPVDKQPKDAVSAATVNQSGFIKCRATRVGEDTTLSQIIQMVSDAAATKAPIAKIADRVSGVFVPAVITIAIITIIAWLIAGETVGFALARGISVLVISCPCALGLATPVAIMVGTGKGAENGILIKSGEALETAHIVDTVVMDKTGTITYGKPVVTDIRTYAGISENDLLKIAGSLEKGSEHPLAEAIVSDCGKKNIVPEKVNDFEALFGKGIKGRLSSGTLYYAGNEKLMEEAHVALSGEIKKEMEQFAKQGKTPLLFADETQIIGVIAVADVVKPTSREAVRQFKEYGIHVIMLTGDNEVTAQAIKDQVGIDEVIAGVLPTQKEEKISALKNSGHKVAMIGDGINDAPALASADVGIAIGAGTDVAIESADIVLMKNDLIDAVGAIRLSKAVIRNIKENLFWAFFYNSIGIPLAAGLLYPIWGLKLNPMFGAAAMSLSSVCVVSNALRLRWVKLGKKSSSGNETGNMEQESAVCENRAVTSEIKTKSDVSESEEQTMKTTLSIEGMMCGHCQATVEKALKGVPGVSEVVVSLEDKNAVVTAEESVSADALKAAVVDAGYEVTNIQ